MDIQCLFRLALEQRIASYKIIRRLHRTKQGVRSKKIPDHENSYKCPEYKTISENLREVEDAWQIRFKIAKEHRIYVVAGCSGGNGGASYGCTQLQKLYRIFALHQERY